MTNNEINNIVIWGLNLKRKLAFYFSPIDRKYLHLKSPKYYEKKIKRLGGIINE